MNDLDDLAKKYGTDKCTQVVGSLSPKGYTIQYYHYLSNLRNKPITLLEIGIAEGASLRMWEEFFPYAWIYGIDIMPSCKKLENKRTKVFIGDQGDCDFLHSVVEAINTPIDVIIDDGGHKMSQHSVSLEVLFPSLSPGGLYAIEDLHTAYWNSYEGGYLKKKSTIEYLKKLVDSINSSEAITKEFSLFQKISMLVSRRKIEPLPQELKDLQAIHFYKSIAFLFRIGSQK